MCASFAYAIVGLKLVLVTTKGSTTEMQDCGGDCDVILLYDWYGQMKD